MSAVFGVLAAGFLMAGAAEVRAQGTVAPGDTTASGPNPN